MHLQLYYSSQKWAVRWQCTLKCRSGGAAVWLTKDDTLAKDKREWFVVG